MGEPMLSTEEIDTVRYWAGLDGDHAMKRRVLRLLAEHAALGVWLATRTGERDAALRDLAELREAAAKLEADLRAETGRANHWQSENHEWCAWAGKFLHERGCERRKRLGGGPMPKMLRASVAGYTRQIERALAETRESVRGAVKAGHVARNGRGWAKVLEAIDVLAALLPAEPPKEASDGK